MASAILIFHSLDTLFEFAWNSFEKRQVDPCRFSKEFFSNPGYVSTNGKKGIKILKRKVRTLSVFRMVVQIQELNSGVQ
jgi:hypothetical protein